jgi:hypothetical protein
MSEEQPPEPQPEPPAIVYIDLYQCPEDQHRVQIEQGDKIEPANCPTCGQPMEHLDRRQR